MSNLTRMANTTRSEMGNRSIGERGVVGVNAQVARPRWLARLSARAAQARQAIAAANYYGAWKNPPQKLPRKGC